MEAKELQIGAGGSLFEWLCDDIDTLWEARSILEVVFQSSGDERGQNLTEEDLLRHNGESVGLTMAMDRLKDVFFDLQAIVDELKKAEQPAQK